MIAEKIKSIDPGAGILKSNDGNIYLAPGLQGRIFCSVGDMLIHKLDFELAANPADGFNNIGGNSFWPAPEGGIYAYNYPNGEWTVQDGINKVCPRLAMTSDTAGVVTKNITMRNAKGIDVELEYKREVRTNDISGITSKFGVKGVSYISKDTFTPLQEYSTNDVLLNAWTLEQFPGAEGITAFGEFACAEAEAKDIVNDDFYGDPLARITFGDRRFEFALGGENRLQIGFKKRCRPKFIGAYDKARGVLIIRQTEIMNCGRYINIADNDQKNGPFSTEDVYSIFNGGAELNFYELETIAPMIEVNGKLSHSLVESTTSIFCGDEKNLLAVLQQFRNS